MFVFKTPSFNTQFKSNNAILLRKLILGNCTTQIKKFLVKDFSSKC